jgi:hypothetical protein
MSRKLMGVERARIIGAGSSGVVATKVLNERNIRLSFRNKIWLRRGAVRLSVPAGPKVCYSLILNNYSQK